MFVKKNFKILFVRILFTIVISTLSLIASLVVLTNLIPNIYSDFQVFLMYLNLLAMSMIVCKLYITNLVEWEIKLLLKSGRQQFINDLKMDLEETSHPNNKKIIKKYIEDFSKGESDNEKD